MTAATERHVQYCVGWPCAITATDAKGRHLIAARDFEHGETVLVSEAYLTSLLPSHKKRICAACLHDCGRRLTVHCGGCGEAWYCSEACREAHTAGTELSGAAGQQGDVPRIAHSMLCPVLSHFGGLKADADMECILRMCLDLLALQRLEAAASEAAEGASSSQAGSGPETGPARALHADGRLGERPSEPAADAAPADGMAIRDAGGQATAAAASSAADEPAGDAMASSSGGAQSPLPPPPPLLPPLRHADFDQLQCHPVSGSERDAQQWRRATAFLVAALQRSGWPQPLPSQAKLLSWAGRIAANSFYRYSEGSSGSRVAHVPCSRPRPQRPAQEGVAQRSGVQGCLQPPAGSRPGGSDGPAAVQQGAGIGDGRQAGGAKAAGPAAEAAPAHLQAAADVNAQQQQLQRLQLAQRRLWQGAAGTAGAGARLPGAGGRAGSAPPACELAAAGTQVDSAAPDVPLHSCALPTADAGTQRQPALASGTAGVLGQSTATAQLHPPPPQQQAGQGATDDSSSAASLGPAAVDSASGCARLQPVGRALFITASYLNHSCQPNCIIHRRAAISVVTAQANIKAGDELCISYIDLEMPRSARQVALKRMFHFVCNCQRCQQEQAEGSGKCTYADSGAKGGKAGAPKRRGRKARTSR